MKIGFILNTSYLTKYTKQSLRGSTAFEFYNTLKLWGYDVTLIGTPLLTDTQDGFDYEKIYETDINKYDCFVLNCYKYTGMMGGAVRNQFSFNTFALLNKIAETNKKVYYYLTDPQLHWRYPYQIGKYMVELKHQLANNLLKGLYLEQLKEFDLNARNCDLNPAVVDNMICLLQGSKDKFINFLATTKDKEIFKFRSDQIFEFPAQYLTYMKPIDINPNPTHALVWGGSKRNIQIYRKIWKYFENPDITSYIISSFKFSVELKYANCVSAVPYNNFGNECNKHGYATVLFTDTSHTNIDCVQRRWVEMILSRIVCFVEKQSYNCDKLFEHAAEELKRFLIINNMEQLKERLKIIMENIEYRKTILNMQDEWLEKSKVDLQKLFSEITKSTMGENDGIDCKVS